MWLLAVMQGLRNTHSEELLLVKKALQEEKALNGDLVRSHKAELADLKKDIAEKVCAGFASFMTSV